MGWRFCPRCETELVDGRLCPACGYDEATEPPPAVPEPHVPFVERYGGPAWATAPSATAAPLRRGSRARLLVSAAILLVVLLYGSLVTVADLRAREDRPAPPLPGAIHRP